MFEPKVKIRKTLYDKIESASQAMGCASVEEFVEKTLEAEAERVLSQSGKENISKEEIEDISNKLKGLGYLD